MIQAARAAVIGQRASRLLVTHPAAEPPPNRIDGSMNGTGGVAARRPPVRSIDPGARTYAASHLWRLIAYMMCVKA